MICGELYLENYTWKKTPALYVWVTMCLNSVSVFSKAKQDPQVSGLEDSFTQSDASSQFIEYFSLWANIYGWQWSWTRTRSSTAKKIEKILSKLMKWYFSLGKTKELKRKIFELFNTPKINVNCTEVAVFLLIWLH